MRGILPRGGTILGSSRTNPFKIEGGVERIKANLAEQGVDALVAIGGEDTLGVATKLNDLGVNVVGVPKTIDNDLGATDYTFGFDTAVNIAMEAIDRLHTTAESHHRTLVVEVMGRHAGWIALHAGLAGGANVILLPERKFDVDAGRRVRREALPDQYAPIVVVAEGAQPLEGQMVAAQPGARRVRPRPARRHRPVAGRAAGGEDRQGGPHRGARPHPARRHPDRVRPGARHPRSASGDRRGPRRAFGKMVALRGTDIVRVPLIEATGELKTVPLERYAEAEVFFG